MPRTGDTSPGRAICPQRLKIPASAHPLVRQLFREMRDQRVDFKVVARRAGVSWQAMSGWRYRACPPLTSIEACLQVMGFELVARPRGGRNRGSDGQEAA